MFNRPLEEKVKLFLVFGFLLLVALGADFAFFGCFFAAGVFAFFASLLGFFAAAFRLHGSAQPGHRECENGQQSECLHIRVT